MKQRVADYPHRYRDPGDLQKSLLQEFLLPCRISFCIDSNMLLKVLLGIGKTIDSLTADGPAILSLTLIDILAEPVYWLYRLDMRC